jgi:hypothetical protein
MSSLLILTGLGSRSMLPVVEVFGASTLYAHDNWRVSPTSGLRKSWSLKPSFAERQGGAETWPGFAGGSLHAGFSAATIVSLAMCLSAPASRKPDVEGGNV